MIEFNLVCRMCGDNHTIEVDKNNYDAWKAGALIQKVMPYLNSEQREMLISQTCDNCWDKLWQE